jgi:SPP1 gp7 family putative phage head morphogenesis protein
VSWGGSAAFNGRFEEAVAWMRARVPMTDDEYAALQARARRKAFTVAGIAQLDLVSETLDALTAAVADGTTFEDFKTAMFEKLSAAWGDSKRAGSRLETIWRTNLQLAYSAGRYAQLTDPDVLDSRPYWMYDAILDNRTSGLCRTLNGTVLEADNAWWNSHIPPLHHRCRSGLRSLTRDEARSRGITDEPSDLEPSNGFGYRPDLDEWQPDPTQYPGDLWDVFESHQMERSPRLTPAQLPKDRRVPQDALLRGASPEEVAGAVRAWLANERPSHNGVRVTLAADEDAVRRVQRRWERLCRTNGINPLAAQINRTDRAMTMFGEIVLMPQTVEDLGGAIGLRARGARTLMHEWWHAARRDTAPFYPLEEGTADAFADRMALLAFGLRPRADWRAYNDLYEAVTLIGDALGADNWYLVSRTEPDVRAWLRASLEDAGFNTVAVGDVLGYTRDDSVWLTRVRRMIATKE